RLPHPGSRPERSPSTGRNGINPSGLTRAKPRTNCPKNLTQPSTANIQVSLTIGDIHTGTGPHVHCVGKGRKERRTPLLPDIVGVLEAWTHEHGGPPEAALFTTTTGRPLSRDAIEQRIRVAVQTAAVSCPSLKGKHVTAHTLRHTAAM